MSAITQSLLSAAEWQLRATAHRERAREWTDPFRHRRVRRERHPVYDFLFVYYRFSPGKLENWHPGIGVALEVGDDFETDYGKHYCRTGGVLTLDPSTLDSGSRARLVFMLQLARVIEGRPAQFGCSGLHEWAMVYRGNAEGEIRHAESLPLRLPQAAVDEVVEKGPVTCSHYDAVRWDMPPSRSKPLRAVPNTNSAKVRLEGVIP